MQQDTQQNNLHQSIEKEKEEKAKNLKTTKQKIREDCISITKQRIRESVKKDTMIIQAVSAVDEIDKVANILAKRLREWYEYYNPEFSKSIESHQKFSELIISKNKEELLKEVGIREEESMGADLPQEDVDAIVGLAKEIFSLYRQREQLERYIEKEMKKLCPNLSAVAGEIVGAKLLSHAGSLQRLASMTSTTIQVLGAERALFRHMKFKTKAPKHGIILIHPLLQKAKNKGKAARAISDKISIAVKVDFFKGQFIGDKLRQELEMKIE
ncbi:MAG: NOP5/NOP56 family protein [Candidatus Woesearchaeota archaeon]